MYKTIFSNEATFDFPPEEFQRLLDEYSHISLFTAYMPELSELQLENGKRYRITIEEMAKDKS